MNQVQPRLFKQQEGVGKPDSRLRCSAVRLVRCHRAFPCRRWLEGQLAIDAGDEERGIAKLWASAEALADTSVDLDPRGGLDLVRLLAHRGDAEGARRARDVLAAGGSPHARALLQVADGLLADDPAEAVRILREAAERLEALGTRVDLGIVLLDLGRAERRAGEDPAPIFERARALFVECGAARYVPEADAELTR